MDRIDPRALKTPAYPGEGAEPRIAILIPCFNEELTIARVVEAFRRGSEVSYDRDPITDVNLLLREPLGTRSGMRKPCAC